MAEEKRESTRNLLEQIEGGWDAHDGDEEGDHAPRANGEKAQERDVVSPPASAPSLEELDARWGDDLFGDGEDDEDDEDADESADQGTDEEDDDDDDDEDETDEADESEPELPDERLDPVAYAAAKKAREERAEDRRKKRRAKLDAKRAKKKARAEAIAKKKKKQKSKKARGPSPRAERRARAEAKAEARAKAKAAAKASARRDEVEEASEPDDEEAPVSGTSPKAKRAEAPLAKGPPWTLIAIGAVVLLGATALVAVLLGR